MNKDQNQSQNNLVEQEAPLKNTDQAFVQVGHDGSPVIPQEGDNKDTEQKGEEGRQHS